MTKTGAGVAIVVLSGVLAHCAPPPAPRPAPPQPVMPVIRPLAEPGPEFSEWLSLPAANRGWVGRDKGVRAVWYRCYVRSAGRLEVALNSPSGALSYEVFDDSVVLASRKDHPLMLARGDTRSGSGSIFFDVHGGVYYIHVATETPLSTDHYVLSVTFTKETAPLRMAQTQPAPIEPTVVTPAQPVQPEPPPPPPPSAAEQSLADAQILSAGVTDTIGPSENFSKRAYSISVARPGTLTVTLSTESGRVRATLLDGQQNIVQRSALSGSVTLTAPVQPGTYYVRTESGEGEAAKYAISQDVAEILADGTRDNAVPLTTSATFNLSVGQGNAYRTRWAKYTVAQPSYYALCVTLTGAPVTVNTYRDATLLQSTIVGSSDGIVGTVPASTLWFEVGSPRGGHSDATVHLIIHPKISESGFIKRGSQPNPCPHGR